jgi:hypothetical protein
MLEAAPALAVEVFRFVVTLVVMSESLSAAKDGADNRAIVAAVSSNARLYTG